MRRLAIGVIAFACIAVAVLHESNPPVGETKLTSATAQPRDEMVPVEVARDRLRAEECNHVHMCVEGHEQMTPADACSKVAQRWLDDARCANGVARVDLNECLERLRHGGCSELETANACSVSELCGERELPLW